MAYNGPTEIGHFTLPGRGTTYSFKLEGHDVQLYVTEKRKKLRVFIDHAEYEPACSNPKD
jgi:hypothetical protein